jgi:acetylglutamate kinase
MGGELMDKNSVVVVKIGGATLGSQDTTIDDVVSLQKKGRRLVIVHGGGKIITDWLEKQDVPSRFVRGERVTDRATLQVAVAVLAGLVNKQIVAAINDRGGQAVGISGVDGALIQAKIKDEALGYVGAVVSVNAAPLWALLNSGYIPVVAPISLNLADKSGQGPPLVNINADDVAGEIAAAIEAEQIVFLTDVVGICDRSGQLMPRLRPDEAEELVNSGVASGGMIPKIRASLRALSMAEAARIIDGRQPQALLRELEGENSGTTIGVVK